MFKSTDLKGSNRCYDKKGRGIRLSSGKEDRYKHIAFQKQVIKNWFSSKQLGYAEETNIVLEEMAKGTKRESLSPTLASIYDDIRSILKNDGRFDFESLDIPKARLIIKLASRESYVKNLMANRFYEFGADTKESAKKAGERAIFNVLRYLRDETREIIVPSAEVLDIFGEDVETRPDLIAINHRKHTIEAIKIACRKPDVSETTRSKLMDRSVATNLEIFCLYKYAKKMAETNALKLPSKYEPFGCIYFLRKKEEKSDSPDENYFDFGVDVNTLCTHVVSLSANSKVLKSKAGYTEANYEKLMTEFLIGGECTPEMCEKCEWDCLCNHQEPPLPSETPKKEKSIDSLSLSPKQEEVMYFKKGIMRVNAGAGSGKTTVVALNTAMMIAGGIDPSEILLITFSNAGAGEMKERSISYLKNLGIECDTDDLSVVTFNEFGQRILEKEYERFGFTAPPRPIDETEANSIVTNLLNKTVIPGLNYEHFHMDLPFAKGARIIAREAIRTIKDKHLGSYDEELLKEALDSHMGTSIKDPAAIPALLALYEDYQDEMIARNFIDFADQGNLLLELLEMEPYYFDTLGYKHIIVDEFQDTSEDQLNLIKQMISVAGFESLLVVGDDSQCIYTWRNADISNIVNLEEKLELDVKDVNLTENYRSTPEIIEFANSINRLNKTRVDKDLVSMRESGKPVTVKGFHKLSEEFEYIAQIVEEKLNEGFQPEDIAILARTKGELVKLAGYLAEAGIETSIQCPQAMLENYRVKGICSLARAYEDITATKEVLAFKNCLMNGKAKALNEEELEELIAEGQAEILAIRKEFEPKRAQSFQKLAHDIAGVDAVAEDFACRFDRFSTTDEMIDYIMKFVRYGGENLKREGRYSGLTLSTSHSSKGLEWPVVINSITHYDRRGGMNASEVEEQRRLLFVSATRARDELYITSQIRVSGNKSDGYSVNRFLQECYDIKGEILDTKDLEGAEERKARRKENEERVERSRKKAAEEREAESASK